MLLPSSFLFLLTLGRLVASEVQVIYPQSLPTVTIQPDASFDVSDAIEVSTTTISQENIEVTQTPTTKTVFGYDDFVTTVDNTVMVFTPDANGGTESISTSVTASSIFSTPSHHLEQKLEPLIKVSTDVASKTASIHPSKVLTSNTPSLQPSKQAISEEDDQLTESTEEEEEDGEDREAFEEKVEDELETEFRTEKSVTMSSSSDMEPFTSDENKIDTTNEVKEKDTFVKGTAKEEKRPSAAVSYKERLKERLAKEKAKLAKLNNISKESQTSERRMFSLEDDEDQSHGSAAAYKPRIPRERRFRSRFDQVEREDDAGDKIEERSSSREGGASSRRSRISRGRSSSVEEESRSSFSRGRSNSFRDKVRDSIREQNTETDTPRFTPSQSSRNRFTPTNRDFKPDVNTPAPKTSPRTTKKSTGSPKIVFKKFNRFDRPDRRALLRSKLFGNRPRHLPFGKKPKLDEESNEIGAKEKADNADEGIPPLVKNTNFPIDNEAAPSALVLSALNDEDTLQDLAREDNHLSQFQTTLSVSTVHPVNTPEQILEVATIRSPYTFNVEDNQKSTRFITVTRTSTKEISPTSSLTSSLEASIINPTPSSVLKHTPLFDTASIPAPENILATTPTHLEIEGSSETVVLPALTILSPLHLATPPLNTITESFTTDKVVIRESILPVVKGTDTSLFTLSQTFSITKVVTAIKTLPPTELYEFNAESSFTDFDNLFDGAGSEHREALLPEELEFSDQDKFGLENSNEIRVTPPGGFLGDLDGDKRELILKGGSEQLNTPPSIEPSFQSSIPTTEAPQGLDLGALAGLGITPEQLVYLQLLQNPLAALGLGGQRQQVVTESSPVYKTEPVVESSVLQLFLGAKEFFTTLTSTVGFTTKTDYVLSTRMVSKGGLGGLGALGALGGLQGLQGLQPQREQQAPQGLGALLGQGVGQGVKIVSSAVTRDLVVTETDTEEYQLVFRNRPTKTTLTSTRLVTTQVISYVTQTITTNPLAGLLG